MDDHMDGCECKRCEMARGYMECGDMNLELATAYANLEAEVAEMEV